MRISEETQNMAGKLAALRADLHAMPEPAWREEETSRYIMSFLAALEPDTLEICAGTAVRAVFLAKNAVGTVAFRADMDALPLDEQTGLPCASRHDGMMHACGHDAHMAVMLALAQLTVRRRDRLKKNMVFLFEPAEEDDGGARALIEAGAMDDPHVDAIYGLHMWPDIDAGKAAVKEGLLMADLCDFDIDITGREAHGARREEGADAALAAATLIYEANRAAERIGRGEELFSVNFGRITAGRQRNIVCGHAHIEGTLRTRRPEAARQMMSELDVLMKKTAQRFGTECELRELVHYPAVINNASLAASAAALFEEDELADIAPVPMAEDFSRYQQRVPGLFIFIGTRDAARHEPLHSPRFDLSLEALGTGLEVMKRIAFDE